MDPGGLRERKAGLVAAAIAAVWVNAQLALFAALTSAVRRTVAAVPPPARNLTPQQRRRAQQARAATAANSARRLAAQTAAIIAAAIARTLAILIAAGISPRAHVPVPGDLARTASFATISEMLNATGRNAYRSVVGAYRGITASLPADATVAQRMAAAQTALTLSAGKGFTGFTDSLGRHWDMATYVEMTTRTAVADMIREEQWTQIRADGGDLVLVYSRWAEHICVHCRPWLGKVISLTGTTAVGGRISVTEASGHAFTATVAGTLAEMLASGWAHPNCRCSTMPVGDGADLSDFRAPVETAAQAAVRHTAARTARDRQNQAREAARHAMSALTPRAKARARGQLAELRRR